jgi:hypothetical protein
VRVNEQGEQIVSVAVPVQRFRGVLGVLMLSTEGGDIDNIVAGRAAGDPARLRRRRLVMAILSLLLASTIANPLRRLAAAAVRVRRGVKNREEIPTSPTARTRSAICPIALRDMTNALYARIEAIESFAADVSHELKNPLTSLRSAVETLPLARNDESRKRLMDVIQHDVRRLDRLITDISDASRLDAELAREDAAARRPEKAGRRLVAMCARRRPPQEARSRSSSRPASCRQGAKGWTCHRPRSAARAGVTNLIENARSFVPDDIGRIVVTCRAPPGVSSSRSRTTAPASAPKTSTASSSASTPIAPAARLWPEFRPRPVDQPPDRRGAWRHADRRKRHRRQAGRHSRCAICHFPALAGVAMPIFRLPARRLTAGVATVEAIVASMLRPNDQLPANG